MLLFFFGKFSFKHSFGFVNYFCRLVIYILKFLALRPHLICNLSDSKSLSNFVSVFNNSHGSFLLFCKIKKRVFMVLNLHKLYIVCSYNMVKLTRRPSYVNRFCFYIKKRAFRRSCLHARLLPGDQNCNVNTCILSL